MQERLSTEDKSQDKDAFNEMEKQDLPELLIQKPDYDKNGLSREEQERLTAYHEAAHAVFYVMQGETVREVFIADENGACKTALAVLRSPGGPVPILWQALDQAVAVLAGDVAMYRYAGQLYPWRTWEELVERVEDLKAWDDSDDLENDDAMKIREFCETAALWGQAMPDEQELADMVRKLVPDESSEVMPTLPQLPPRTPEEVFEQALSAAEERVDALWPAIEDVAERLVEVGRLTGEEVEEIVMNSGLFEQAD